MMINEDLNDLETAHPPGEIFDSKESMNEGSMSFTSDDGSDGDELADEPLTKATLLTFTSMSSPWMVMGSGVVSVDVSLESSEPATRGGSGKIGKAETDEIASGLTSQRVGRLVMVDLEDAEELLISTPIAIDCNYQTQGDFILMWEDPQLGRTMSFKFAHEEGRRKIVDDIAAYQQSERERRAEAESMELAVSGGSTRRPAAAEPTHDERWAVTAEHLPDIADAVSTKLLDFGLYVRDNPSYFKHLSSLFDESKKAGDTAAMEQVSQIVLALLDSPYNSEGKILAQFMESAYVDKCVDIVQYGLGRRDAATGFVSFEERRATFKNPLSLPESMLTRIHLLYSAMYLRDLLPLSLDDGDGTSPCVLNLLLLRFKFSLINEICTKPELLPHAFEQLQGPHPDRVKLYSLVNFVQDISKMIKNAPIGLDLKEDLYKTMILDGLFAFCAAVIRCGLQDLAASASADPAAEVGNSSVTDANIARAIECGCDVLSHCLFIVPTAREELVAECRGSPSECVLMTVMRCLTVLNSSSGLQAAHDVVLGAAVGVQALQLYQPVSSLGAQREMVRFWVQGKQPVKPPLLHVIAHTASLLQKADGLSAQWSPSEELQIVYGLRVLNLVVEKIEEGFRTSFAMLVSDSELLTAMHSVLRLRGQRRLENVQSSVVSFLTKLITLGDGNVMRLLDTAPEEDSEQLGGGLLHVCMELYLALARRSNILSSALGSLFMYLCTEVHQEKLSQADAMLFKSSPIESELVKPLDGSNQLNPDYGATPRDESTQRRFQKAASALVAEFGDRLQECAPVVAVRLRNSLDETPEEAQMARAETSSLPSSIARPIDGLSDYEAFAMDCGVDVPPPRSLSSSPSLEAAAAAAEDSLLNSLLDSSDGEDDQVEEEADGLDAASELPTPEISLPKADSRSHSSSTTCSASSSSSSSSRAGSGEPSGGSSPRKESESGTDAPAAVPMGSASAAVNTDHTQTNEEEAALVEEPSPASGTAVAPGHKRERTAGDSHAEGSTSIGGTEENKADDPDAGAAKRPRTAKRKG